MLSELTSDLKAWASKPYKEEGDLLDWFLFIGVITAATVLWTMVIKRLVD